MHRDVADLDVQLIPVSVLWGRSPGKEDKASLPNLRLLNGLQKTFAAIWFGRDTFVRFSQALSLRYMVNEHGSDEKIAQKLARVAKMHFAKQRISATGPRLPNREAMFNKLFKMPLKMRQNQKISAVRKPMLKPKKFFMKLRLM